MDNEWDPWKRYRKEQERRIWDPWYRDMYRREYGLNQMEYGDLFYTLEKEEGLGTRAGDYLNPEYRLYMDIINKKKKDDLL